MTPKGIRPFIGSDDFEQSKDFYRLIGFTENWSSTTMSYFDLGGFGFYLQDAHVEDWINNSMLFLEIEDLEKTLEHFKSLDLPSKFKKVRLSEIVHNDWGSEFFLHDPSGILWHIGRFAK
ncbi:VOC family protein [Nonlabens agnitus]|uniref:Glyoxalase n=1 Tax=Nonlabens agnitus TaxID=870484 RepID=A0A2S9WW79_9FLAO|nr:glyoxalase [Nonlabens agnitus]PRP67626.1 glyoxalase [Nonlabens agnitus]